MRPSRLPILALPLAALAITGCGGGGGDSSSEATQAPKQEKPAALTKADFITQGDGICAEVNSAVGSIEDSEVETATDERASQVAGLYTGMIERLTKLGTPTETDGYAEFSEAAETLGKVEGEVSAAADEEEGGALEEASNEAVPALEGFQNAAAVYGFEECSEAPSAPTPATGTPGAEGEEEAPEGLEEEFVPEEEVAPEEEFIPEEEVAPEEEEFIPEEEVAPEEGGGGGVGEEAPAPEEESGGESGGVGPG